MRRPTGLGQTSWVSAIFAAAASIWLCATTAHAQTVYRWTDENGVVHFADSPPAQGTNYEVRALAIPPPPPAGRAPMSSPTPAEAAAETPEASPAPSGPARVVVEEQESVPLGGSVQAFSGTVENHGGATAQGVVVAITVTEPNQGAECLRDHIAVEPSTLAPGASGTYYAEFDNPCFFGATSAALRTEWR